ncbi:OmpL47-type beta-barrel domain-containing protein [Agromyces albus]|uniref:OmpL47-type beta-barrel domain-containing protein n=1 Tax=Agromyces albus TaxID=205332 RepID=UPI0027D7D150|nr:hypothetical protein [Agromyces albus]
MLVVGVPSEPGGNPVDLRFAATDAHSGVLSTEVRVDEGAWTEVGSEPVRIADVGRTTVSYRSTDAAGNVEDAREVVVEITEPEPPTIELGSGKVAAGGSLGVTGTGFVPGEAVRVGWPQAASCSARCWPMPRVASRASRPDSRSPGGPLGRCVWRRILHVASQARKPTAYRRRLTRRLA